MIDYILLFGASFLAATVLPFYSEIALYLLVDEGASPLLLLHRTEIDDVAGGNGNGDINIGETADIAVSLSNYGRGSAQGLVATVTAPAGSGLIVNTGSSVMGDLDPLTGHVRRGWLENSRRNY